MAKKQASRERDAGKARFELRFDEDLYAKTKELADKAGISVNQLMQGLTRWLVERAQVGEPYRDEDGGVQVRQLEGCIWVGCRAFVLDDDERLQVAFDNKCRVEDVPRENKGNIALFLDFTERRVVRDDI